MYIESVYRKWTGVPIRIIYYLRDSMINMGSHKVYTNKKDGWTVYTEDGLPSAQWEYMVLVTDTGYEVLAY